MGNPWCHGRCGLLVLVLVHGVSHASRCRQYTHVMVACPLPSCIEVMGGALGALNCLKLISRCVQQIGHTSGKSQSKLGKLVCIFLLSARHAQGRWGMWRTLVAHADQVMTVLMCVQSPYDAESSHQRGRTTRACDPTQTGVRTARSLSQL